MTCLHLDAVAIVKALLDHGANPNCEEGVPVKTSDLSIQREDEGEGEKLRLRDEAPGTANKVTFCVGDENGVEQGGGRVVNITEKGEIDYAECVRKNVHILSCPYNLCNSVCIYYVVSQ